MAIDPDVQILLDAINARLDALEAGGGGAPHEHFPLTITEAFAGDVPEVIYTRTKPAP